MFNEHFFVWFHKKGLLWWEILNVSWIRFILLFIYLGSFIYLLFGLLEKKNQLNSENKIKNINKENKEKTNRYISSPMKRLCFYILLSFSFRFHDNFWHQLIYYLNYWNEKIGPKHMSRKLLRKFLWSM